MSNNHLKSQTGHWSLDSESIEYVQSRIVDLRQRVSDISEGTASEEIETITKSLNQINETLSTDSEETKRQIHELIGFIDRFKRIVANRFLEIGTELKAVQSNLDKLAKDTGKQEKHNAQLVILERWKLLIGVILVFFSGLIFPILLYLFGVSKP
jgi:predicted RNase H-like nuclease (RuvC/YqgF family)